MVERKRVVCCGVSKCQKTREPVLCSARDVIIQRSAQIPDQLLTFAGRPLIRAQSDTRTSACGSLRLTNNIHRRQSFQSVECRWMQKALGAELGSLPQLRIERSLLLHGHGR